MKFYSATTRGFYAPEVHGEQIPADAVEVSEEDYAALLEAQSAGKHIAPGKGGEPVAIDRPQLTDSQVEAQVRAERARLLAASDVLVLPDRWANYTPERQADLASYRQALRDVPSQPGFPRTVEWPEPIK